MDQLVKFHENSALLGGGGGERIDSILEAGGQQTQKLNQLAPVTLDFCETFQGTLSGKYLQTPTLISYFGKKYSSKSSETSLMKLVSVSE